jgi:hypothetical protein
VITQAIPENLANQNDGALFNPVEHFVLRHAAISFLFA